MIASVLILVLSGAPIGACADRAACRFKVGDDAALKEALAGLELTAGELKAEPLKKAGGDLAFALSSSRQGEQVVVKATGLQRAATVYGEGAAAVMAVKKPQWKQRALVSALKVAIGRALEDLAARISGVRKVTLSAQLTGLDLKGREHVERSLLPCLKGLFDLVGPVTSPVVSAGYLDEPLEYLPEKDEPRVALDWQVARVRAAMLAGPRSKCSVAFGPLQGWSTLVNADVLNGAVVVSFKR
jgi:hypothetical protein